MRAKVLIGLVTLLAAGALTVGASATGVPPVQVARLVPVGDSGVSGLVVIAPASGGGSIVAVLARGLAPGTQYTSFYYDDHFCHVGPEEVGTFTANPFGVGLTFATIDEDPDEVGSISVRTPDYSVLFACARLAGGE